MSLSGQQFYGSVMYGSNNYNLNNDFDFGATNTNSKSKRIGGSTYSVIPWSFVRRTESNTFPEFNALKSFTHVSGQ